MGMNMRLIPLFSLLILSLSLVSCAKDDIFEAKKMQNQASKAGYEWRDVDDMIKKAEKAFLDGDSDEASRLAKAAILQGKMALEQAEAAKQAGPVF
jgi:uncharacterized protein YabN with tetrapyrrole methylase and pyrophosphatase domain